MDGEIEDIVKARIAKGRQSPDAIAGDIASTLFQVLWREAIKRADEHAAGGSAREADLRDRLQAALTENVDLKRQVSVLETSNADLTDLLSEANLWKAYAKRLRAREQAREAVAAQTTAPDDVGELFD